MNPFHTNPNITRPMDMPMPDSSGITRSAVNLMDENLVTRTIWSDRNGHQGECWPLDGFNLSAQLILKKQQNSNIFYFAFPQHIYKNNICENRRILFCAHVLNGGKLLFYSYS